MPSITGWMMSAMRRSIGALASMPANAGLQNEKSGPCGPLRIGSSPTLLRRSRYLPWRIRPTGESRFYQSVAKEAPKNSQAFVNFVGSGIDQFHLNTPQNDDITISTVKRLK